MAYRDEKTGTMSGLTADEAKEFHELFMKGFIGFTIVAVIAHILVWMWRPWFPPVGGYKTSSLMTDGVTAAQSVLQPLIG